MSFPRSAVPVSRTPAAPAPSAAPPRRVVVLGILAVVLIGLNLRAGISGAAALFHDLQQVLGYGALTASILPSIPTLCFAVAGAATSWLTRRIGLEKSIMAALVLLTAGLLVRGVPSTGMLLAGTVAGMCGLAICNVAMPSFIREHYADRTSMMTALYTLSMSGGATILAVLAVPLAQQLGSPSPALGSIGVLSAAAVLAFVPIVLHSHRNTPKNPGPHISPWPLLRTRKGLLLTGIFVLQALLAYAILSWLPYLLTTRGLSPAESGLQFGLMQLVGVPAGALLIAVGSRRRMLRPTLYVVTVVMALGILSLLVLPVSWAALSAVLLGFGTAIFPLVMVLISRSGSTTAETTALSTLAQSVGYLLATAGPFGIGLLHAATGDWTLPLILLLAAALAQIVVAHLLTQRTKS